MQDLKLFSGNANVALARSVATYLDIELGRAEVGTFSDGECAIEIGENVRGLDCFALQSTCAPQNTHLMEMLIMIDALKRASARRITAVIPYYGYARQDRKVRTRACRSPRSSVADLIQHRRHRPRALPRPARRTDPGLLQHPGRQPLREPACCSRPSAPSIGDRPLTIVSPDAGGVERSRAFAKRLGATLAIVDKRREAANVVRGDEHRRRRAGPAPA